MQNHIIKNVRVGGQKVYQTQVPMACAECLELIDPSSTAISSVMVKPSSRVASAQIVSSSDHQGLLSYVLAKPTAGTMTTQEAGYPLARHVLPADVAYQLVSLMKSVIREGTGRRARELQRSDIAGKTGTTNEQRDAWFSGFCRDLVCTTWVGFDNTSPLGRYETGGRAALPMWIDFMRAALAERPEKPYYRPSNIIDARIDPSNGLLAHPMAEDSLLETFREQHMPKKIAGAPQADDGPRKAANEDGLF